ncbi:MAG: pyridoxamine 5'-phosphate oxidase family protein [Chloroflexota bacterium]|nr:MAG: pyridoxamine 5'-phosphate oxidase family protein [Chloroflexota bacterium]
MRRSDREITDQAAIEAIIHEAEFCRLALVDGGQPYIIPLSFGYRDKVLYFHSAVEGKKIDIIKKASKACFEVDVNTKIIEAKAACSWGVEYQSVIAFGEVCLVEDPGEKRKAFDIIMAHYSEKDFQIPNKALQGTAIIKMEIDEMTGKLCRA